MRTHITFADSMCWKISKRHGLNNPAASKRSKKEIFMELIKYLREHSPLSLYSTLYIICFQAHWIAKIETCKLEFELKREENEIRKDIKCGKVKISPQ